jgi:hypothetical protein
VKIDKCTWNQGGEDKVEKTGFFGPIILTEEEDKYKRKA